MRATGTEVRLAPTTEPGSASRQAQTAVQAGCDLILVCGGDGTLNEVANGIVPARVPLGILPGGTANIMAHELGLPLDPVRAAAELSRWQPYRIAVGALSQITGPAKPVPPRYFLSVAGIGFDAYVVSKLDAGFKKSLGVVAYGLEAFRQGLRYSFPRFTCRMNGRQVLAPFAVVQRTSRYGGWLKLAPGASIFTPQFHVCLFKNGGWPRYLVYATAVAAEQHLRLDDVELVEATEIECAASGSAEPIYVELDGELAGRLPATFQVVPDALTLLVPPKSLEANGQN